jgi:hypothetical protein
MVNHPGQPITLKNIADLVGQAHQRAFTPKKNRDFQKQEYIRLILISFRQQIISVPV